MSPDSTAAATNRSSNADPTLNSETLLAESEARPRFDSLEQEAYLHLWRTYDALKVLEEQVFSPVGLSAQQYNALRLLQAVAPGTLTIQGLGSRLISRAPDMTRLLDRLEQRQLVERRRRTDNRRVIDVAITPAGTELLQQLVQPVRECHQRQLGHLTPVQIQELIDLLRLSRAPHSAELHESGDSA